jgi:AcrR family transcriptional regulator
MYRKMFVMEPFPPDFPCMRTAKEKYMTDAQSSRIQRILEATRRLLGEVGAEQMTMRDLAAASGVATATLYNRFGSKDNIIVLTVLDHYDQAIHTAMSQVPFGATPLQKIVYGLGVFDADIRQVQGLARALMSAYFRLEGSREMPDALYKSAYETWFPILQEMRHRRMLRSWVAVELLCEEICDRQFGVVMKWSQKAISDKDLLMRLKFSVLSTLLASATAAQGRLIELELQKDCAPPKAAKTPARRSR